MKVSIEEKRAEAIKRMKAFGFFHEAIELFEADGTPLSSNLKKSTVDLFTV